MERVLEAAGRLLDGITAGAAPLAAVSGSLAELATRLQVDRVIVAVDDPQYGRQVFCSGRAPLGASGLGLWGPPRVCTVPPTSIDPAAAGMLIRVVRAGFARCVEQRRSIEVAGRDQVCELTAAVEAAASRALRHGWAFTLVVGGFDCADAGQPPVGPSVAASLRSGDVVIDLGKGEFGLLLHATTDEEVPAVLARIARHAALPAFSFGLAKCPGDGDTGASLLAHAVARMHEAALESR